MHTELPIQAASVIKQTVIQIYSKYFPRGLVTVPQSNLYKLEFLAKKGAIVALRYQAYQKLLRNKWNPRLLVYL